MRGVSLSLFSEWHTEAGKCCPAAVSCYVLFTFLFSFFLLLLHCHDWLHIMLLSNCCSFTITMLYNMVTGPWAITIELPSSLTQRQPGMTEGECPGSSSYPLSRGDQAAWASHLGPHHSPLPQTQASKEVSEGDYICLPAAVSCYILFSFFLLLLHLHDWLHIMLL